MISIDLTLDQSNFDYECDHNSGLLNKSEIIDYLGPFNFITLIQEIHCRKILSKVLFYVRILNLSHCIGPTKSQVNRVSVLIEITIVVLNVKIGGKVNVNSPKDYSNPIH